MSFRSLVLCFFLCAAWCALAQTLPIAGFAQPVFAQPNIEKPGLEQPLLPTGEHMVVSVDVVEVYFNVRAGKQLVQGLQKEDFEILENGRRESIRYFSSLSDQPLRIGIMIDSSGSQNRVLQAEKDVAGKFLNQVLSGKDQAMVVSFDSGVELRQDFTDSKELLQQALGRIERVNSHNSPELGDTPVRHRSTALYDSIQMTSIRRMRDTQGRKVFVILTDGEDQGSRAKADEAIAAALQSDAICYVLLVADSNVSSRRNYQGETKMQQLSESTGGRLIRVHKNLRDLQRHFNEIGLELRNHYSLGYTPTNRGDRFEYRKLSVRSKRGYHVQARQGYYAKFEKPAGAGSH